MTAERIIVIQDLGEIVNYDITYDINYEAKIVV